MYIIERGLHSSFWGGWSPPSWEWSGRCSCSEPWCNPTGRRKTCNRLSARTGPRCGVPPFPSWSLWPASLSWGHVGEKHKEDRQPAFLPRSAEIHDSVWLSRQSDWSIFEFRHLSYQSYECRLFKRSNVIKLFLISEQWGLFSTIDSSLPLLLQPTSLVWSVPGLATEGHIFSTSHISSFSNCIHLLLIHNHLNK